MTDIYRIAGQLIEVSSLGDEVHRLCAAYRAEGRPDLSVKTDQADIDLEREKSAREDMREGRPVQDYGDPYLETLAVYRKICERMPEKDTFLFHGSCVAVDGRGYLFTAKSGTGKSTHTRLWRERFGDRALMVNDDKPLLHVGEDGVLVYGTPWDGKHHLSTNTCVPLQAVCHLTRGAGNTIEPVSAGSIYPVLLQQAYRPADPAAMAKTLKLLDRLAGAVGLYRLACNMAPEAADVAYEAMKGSKR